MSTHEEEKEEFDFLQHRWFHTIELLDMLQLHDCILILFKLLMITMHYDDYDCDNDVKDDENVGRCSADRSRVCLMFTSTTTTATATATRTMLTLVASVLIVFFLH